MWPDLWTFPVPGTDALVVTPPDSEGLLFLNPTASCIFRNPDPVAYASRFGIPLHQAESDIRQTQAALAALAALAPAATLHLTIHQTTYQLRLSTQSQIDELFPRLAALQTEPTATPNHTFHLLDKNGCTHLYKKPSPSAKHPRFRPSNLNRTSPTAPPVALIFVNYQPTAESTDLEPIPTFETLLEIQKSGFWIEHTQPAITQFLNWLANIPRYKLTYSNLAAALPALTRLLDTGSY